MVLAWKNRRPIVRREDITENLAMAARSANNVISRYACSSNFHLTLAFFFGTNAMGNSADFDNPV